MPLVLYHFPPSPPSRSALMTLKVLGLDFETKIVDLFNREHRKPEYLAINPLGLVPSLVDGNLSLHESRAIACYLCNKYAKGEKQSLYPSDPDQRAKVDMVLYITEWMFERIIEYLNIRAVFAEGANIAEEHLPRVTQGLAFFEEKLKDQNYVTGQHMTIADIFTAITLTMLDLSYTQHFDAYPNLMAFITRMKSSLCYDECNTEGMEKLKEIYRSQVNTKKQ